MALEAARSVLLCSSLTAEINLWIGGRSSEAELASFRCLPVPPRCWHGAPAADLHGVHKRPGLLAKAGSRLVPARFSAEATLQLHRLHARRARRKSLVRALAIVRPLSPRKRAKLFGGINPHSNSGAITISMIARMDPRGAATSSFHDEGEHDKTGDEPRHHPQQEPMIRFHFLFHGDRRLPSRSAHACLKPDW
jgi:hypothetical protein